MKYPQINHPPGKQGTVLLTVTIIVFLISAASAVTMKLAMTNLQQNEQQRRELQSRLIAESAVNAGVSQLNRELLDKHDLEDLGNPSVHVIRESDSLPFGSLSVPEGGNIVANKATDGFDNDGDGLVDEPDEPDETYTGGKYRIELREWSNTNGIDDDRDGTVDEADEAPEPVTSEPADFEVEAGTAKIDPQQPFKLDVKVIGASPDTPYPDSKYYKAYHGPVTAQVVIEGTENGEITKEPWGPYNDPVAGNIHTHGEKQFTWSSDETYPASATVTFNFRSYVRDNFQKKASAPDYPPPLEQYYTWEHDLDNERKGTDAPDGGNVDDMNKTANLKPARDSDKLPGFKGANNQEDPADFFEDDYISETDDGSKELDLPRNHAIFMGELTHGAEWERKDVNDDDSKEWVCTTCDKGGVDFNDVVLDVDITTVPDAPKDFQDESVTGHAVSHARRFTMDVTGTYGGYTTELGAVVAAEPEPEGKYGVFATNTLSVKKNVVVDSYNADRGTTYKKQQTAHLADSGGADYARTNGNIGANGDVDFNSNTAVMGNVDVGGTNFSGPDYVHQDARSLNETRSFQVPEPPADEDDTPLDAPEYGSETFTKNDNGSDTNIIGQENESDTPSDRFKYTDVTLKKDAVVEVKPDTYIWIQGSFEAKKGSQLIVQGPATIRIDEDFTAGPDFELQAVTDDKPVEVFVGTDVTFKPGSTAYSTYTDEATGNAMDKANPKTENLRLFVGHTTPGGDVKTNSSVANVTVFQGILLGPGADLTFQPHTQLFGTAIGRNVTVKSNVGIHYDEALDKFCTMLWDTCNREARVTSTWIKSTSGSAGQ